MKTLEKIGYPNLSKEDKDGDFSFLLTKDDIKDLVILAKEINENSVKNRLN